MRAAAGALAALASACATQPQHDRLQEHFWYDAPSQVVPGVQLPDRERYDPDVAVVGDETWLCWLRFVPGEGDRIEIGRRSPAGLEVTTSADAPGRLARPTLTADAQDRVWLTWEAQDDDGGWNVWARLHTRDAGFGPAERISRGAGSDINHRVAADGGDGIWVVWQSDRRGQFAVLARHLEPGAMATEQVVSTSLRGDWHPTVAVTAQGAVCVAWDSYTGESFDVLARWLVDGTWSDPIAVAEGPSFQARARAAAGPDGSCWLLWEDGGANWGGPYRSVDGKWNNMTDEHGPVHRLRELRLAAVTSDGAIHPVPVPMPSFASSTGRENRREGVASLGVFYERGVITVDGAGRPWIAYRHYYEPQLGADQPVVHHIEKGFRIYARCLEAGAWSGLQAFDVLQRDGMQRLEISGATTGIAAVWETGRTDRRTDGHTDPEPRGVVTASIREPVRGAPPQRPTSHRAAAPPRDPDPLPERAAPVQSAGQAWQLFYGDLHRHTDLSLCFPFFDGSLDDAYRYAIEVARLDFLGITDHTRDLARGDALSQLWWRSTKEVTRHALAGAFFPYFAYERSHRDTDHNVISLRDDMLRNFPPPLPEFWKEIEDGDTFTIPHAPFQGEVWHHHDDERRPLLEVYQGFRDLSSQAHAHQGLAAGHHVGFIASSDHLSTGASFACVWSRGASRETIFAALKARRTYGATDKIRLVFRSGEHWMGERFTEDSSPELQIEIDGTAPLRWVDVYVDGEALERLGGGGKTIFRTSVRPRLTAGTEHHVYIHALQVDGNQAWSSPMWITTR